MSVVGAFFDWVDGWNGPYELLILIAVVAALLSETWKPRWRRLWRDIRKMIASNRVSAEIAATPAERAKMVLLSQLAGDAVALDLQIRHGHDLPLLPSTWIQLGPAASAIRQPLDAGNRSAANGNRSKGQRLRARPYEEQRRVREATK